MMSRTPGLLLSLLMAVGLALMAQAPRLAHADATSQRLRQALADPRYKIRIQAAVALAKTRPPGARDDLERLLGDEEPLVRAAACDALMALGDAAALPHIEALLRDEADIVRRRARLARRVLREQAPEAKRGAGETEMGSRVRLSTVIDRSGGSYPGIDASLRQGLHEEIASQAAAMAALRRRYELMAQVEEVSVRAGQDQTRVDVSCQLTVAELPRRTLRLSTSVTAAAALGGSADSQERSELAQDAARASGAELIREFVSWAVAQPAPARGR